jgi:hypothetical protein
MKPPLQPERLYSPAEAAEVLHVTVGTLTRYAKAGKVTVRRLPSGHRRYVADEIDAFMVPRNEVDGSAWDDGTGATVLITPSTKRAEVSPDDAAFDEVRRLLGESR